MLFLRCLVLSTACKAMQILFYFFLSRLEILICHLHHLSIQKPTYCQDIATKKYKQTKWKSKKAEM